MKTNKYFAKKTGGYDSKKEAKRASQLELLQKAGVITDLAEQVPFIIQEPLKHKSGNERGIKYLADFVYFDTEKKSWVIEDVKSPITKKLSTYIMKRKMVKKLFYQYLFLEV